MNIDQILMEFTSEREILIGLEYVIGSFFLFYMIQFFIGVIQRKRNKQNVDMQLSWGLFFLGQFLLDVVRIYADFYQNFIPNIISRTYLNNLANAAGLLGLVAISFQIEKILKSGYINSMIISLISICAIFFYYFPSDYLTIFIFVAYSTTIVMIYTAVHSRVEDHPALHKDLSILVGSFVLLFLGNLFKSDFFINLFGNIAHTNLGQLYSVFYIRMTGDIVLIFSIFMLHYSFEGFPTMMELNWKYFVHEIHITSKSGIELCRKDFKNREFHSNLNPDLMAAAMSGVSDIVREVTGSNRNLNLIDQGDYKIMFEKSENCIIFLIVTEPLEIYKFKMKNLMEDIIDIYGAFLNDWVGNVEIFKPMGDLIDKNFNTEGRAAKKIAIKRIEGEPILLPIFTRIKNKITKNKE